MVALLIGYARVWPEAQDLTAQREGLAALGVDPSRVYVDHGLTGTNRDRPGLREAMAAAREGDTLVVTKLDRLARSLPDARAILEELTARQVTLSLGGSVHDPSDPVGRLLFGVARSTVTGPWPVPGNRARRPPPCAERLRWSSRRRHPCGTTVHTDGPTLQTPSSAPVAGRLLALIAKPSHPVPPVARKPSALASRMAVVATLHLMVGLPAAGKTTHAKHLADHVGALRLTPDEWMIPLFNDNDAGGKRNILEGRLVTTALQVLKLGLDVVLDFGLWAREERYALHQLATDHGAQCATVYLEVDRETQWARIRHRWQVSPHETYPMTEAEVDRWQAQFQPPDAGELSGASPPPPPQPWPSWWDWAAQRWPSLTAS